MKNKNILDGKYKHPKTPHLPWSENISDDDKVLKNTYHFVGKRVIISEKLDGENFSLYNDYCHARSLDSRNHVSRNWIRNFHSTIKHDIPEGYRICGENLYATHSIHYTNLKSYFYGFSIWNDKNICLSWDETLEWFKLLNIVPVEVLYDGVYNEEKIKKLYNPKDWETMEGYVIRLAQSFSYAQFRNSVSKFVRKNHILTTKHWMVGQAIRPNELLKD